MRRSGAEVTRARLVPSSWVMGTSTPVTWSPRMVRAGAGALIFPPRQRDTLRTADRGCFAHQIENELARPRVFRIGPDASRTQAVLPESPRKAATVRARRKYARGQAPCSHALCTISYS